MGLNAVFTTVRLSYGFHLYNPVPFCFPFMQAFLVFFVFLFFNTLKKEGAYNKGESINNK